MIWPFKCTHPAKWLRIEKDQTSKPKDEDFYILTNHLRCLNCGELVDIKAAGFVGGVDAFMARGDKNAETSATAL
jgi:hypothetical protein